MTKKSYKEQIKELKEKLEEKEAVIEDYLNTMQRTQADFENFKKRVERDNKNILAFANEGVLTKLLDIKDNFERALLAEGVDKVPAEYAKGFDMIYKQLQKLLFEEGIEEIECIGKNFDPYYHEALIMDNCSDGDKEIVCEEFQKGYIYKNKVMRHSKVKVKKQKSEEDGEKNE
ncbi:MAG: nucleotide exchange factor GrpE [Candidatus Methanofastidiosia archaeon]